MKTCVKRSGLVLLTLLLAACGQQSSPTVTPVDVAMTMRTEPETLTVGETTLIVTLEDAAGNPVDAATLHVHGDMDHEGMMPVDREVSESVNGDYAVPFEWTMGGGWIVTVTAQLPDGGGEISRDFEFFVEAISSESIINRHEASPINITYEPDNDPAIGGDATVTVTLTGENGAPVTDATVDITGDMDHEGMMPIAGTGEHTGNGRYIVPVRWTMAGDWQVTVKVTLADGSSFEAVFDQHVVSQSD